MYRKQQELTRSIPQGIFRRTMLKRMGYGAAGVSFGSNAILRLLAGTSGQGLAAHQSLAATLPQSSLSPSLFVNGQPLQLPFWSDTAQWVRPEYYSTIKLGDIDGDGASELIGRGPAGILVNKFDPGTGQWLQLADGPPLSDTAGWNQPQYYSTIQLADIDGDGQAELLGRSAASIVAYHYDKVSGMWMQLPDGPGLSDAAGWNQPQFYSTIQCADVAGNSNGQAYLLARAVDGLQMWQFDPGSQTWNPVGPTTTLFSDAGGWYQPPYYATIQCSDIDGDGKAEVIGRGAGGIIAFRFDPAANTWDALPNGPALSDAAGWNHPQFYATIQCANLAGNSNGQTYLLARGVSGVQVWRYDPSAQNWTQLGGYLSAFTDAGGWYLEPYYSTIQGADIDGDGQDELLARGAGGIVAYHFNPGDSSWTPLPTGPPWADGTNSSGWGQPSHYSTIHSANIIGTSGIPGSRGKAYLLGRNANGIETWAYQPLTKQWASLSAAFVAFTGGQLNAFNYLGQKYDSADPSPNIRNRYDDLNFDPDGTSQWLSQNYNSLPPDIPPSAPFSLADWQTVSTQIQTELTGVANVRDLFANCNQLVEDTFTTQSLTVSTVAETLELPSSDPDSVVLTVLNVLSNAAWAALGVAAPEASVAAGLLAAGFTAALAGTAAEGGGSISVAYIRLQTELNNWFSNSLTGIGKTEAAVVGDGGLLAAVGKMIQNGTWQWPSTLTPQLVAAAQQQYTISLWQILLPIAWELAYANNDCNKLLLPLGFPQDHHWHDPATNRCYWPVKAGSILIAKYPSSTTWDALFDSPPNGLGIPMADVFLGQNGWPKLKVAVGLGAVLETPQDLLEMFIGRMDTLPIPHGIRHALLGKLQAALNVLNLEDKQSALQQLKAFDNQVRALAEKELTAEDAVDMLDAVAQIRTLITSS